MRIRTTTAQLDIEYRAAPEHCADGRIQFYVDGYEKCVHEDKARRG